MDRLLELFAGILESPGMNLVERVRECARAATAVGVPPEDLEEFARFAENAPQGLPLIAQRIHTPATQTQWPLAKLQWPLCQA